jgi:hypothetical protein
VITQDLMRRKGARVGRHFDGTSSDTFEFNALKEFFENPNKLDPVGGAAP